MKVYSVSEFRDELNELLAQAVVTIEGEIAEYQLSQGKFVWFSLVDQDATVKCFMMAFQVHVDIQNGMKVRVVGAPSMFKKGQLVFKPRTIELVGDGSVQKALEALKKKLQAEGLFDEGRKRSLPTMPEHIAIITSRDAAAYTDILRILHNRWGGLHITLIPAQVQGRGAVESIVSAFAEARTVPHLEAIILARGGGGADDLAAFNTEEVARAVFGAHVPVIAAIGHERDVTIVDYVADVRASTPSNAAERIVPDKIEIEAMIEHYMNACETRMTHRLAQERMRIDTAIHVASRTFTQASGAVVRVIDRVYAQQAEFTHTLARMHDAVEQRQARIRALHPLRVLERGFTLTVDEAGAVIRSKQQVQSGARIRTRTADGQFTSIVD